MEGVAVSLWTLLQTHLGGQGAESGPFYRHICYTRWSKAARTRPPAPKLRRWSTPPCSRQTVASPLWDVSQADRWLLTGAQAGGDVWTLETGQGNRGKTKQVGPGGFILQYGQETIKQTEYYIWWKQKKHVKCFGFLYNLRILKNRSYKWISQNCWLTDSKKGAR